jgi:hypothetical protein
MSDGQYEKFEVVRKRAAASLDTIKADAAAGKQLVASMVQEILAWSFDVKAFATEVK